MYSECVAYDSSWQVTISFIRNLWSCDDWCWNLQVSFFCCCFNEYGVTIVLAFQEDNSVAYIDDVIMVAYCQNCRQRRCVGCLTGFLGCRCRGYEQSSGHTTLVCIWVILLYCLVILCMNIDCICSGVKWGRGQNVEAKVKILYL